MIPLLVTGCTCAVTYGGGLLALRLQAYRAFALAFAAGALVATALIDVIPDSLELLSRSGSSLHTQHLMIACAFGFLGFYLFEQTVHGKGHHHHHHEPVAPEISEAGLFGAWGMSIHSLLDGVAIGEAFHAGTAVGWIVALAVIMHKFADGVSTVEIVVSVGRGERLARVMLAITAIAPLAGFALQWFVPLPLTALAIVLGWFSGVFLYLGATALIPAAHAASGSRWLPVATLAGVALVYLGSLAPM
jgi:zinc transporter ZupT